MLPIELIEYEYGNGRSPFGRWFAELDGQTAQRVTFALEKMAKGNTSNVKGVGGGVSELKMDFGPGYRIYFGRDGDTLIVLLTGGTKKAPAERHRKGNRVLDGLQATKTSREITCH